jgi:hypothetical protein
MASAGASSTRRALRPIGWGMAVLFVAALAVQMTHTGIDVFLVLVTGFVLLVLERTLGDWIAESIGAPATALVFAIFAALAVAYAMSGNGRAKANRFFASAESRGYRPLYFVVDESTDDAGGGKVTGRGTSRSGAAGNAAPAGKGDGSAPAAVATGGASPAPGIFDWPKSPDRSRHLRLRADPEVAASGNLVTLRATLESPDRKDSLVAVFTVNGAALAKVPFDSSGNASAQFEATVPGLYTARAHVSPGAILGQDVSASFNVLPAGSRPVRKSR